MTKRATLFLLAALFLTNAAAQDAPAKEKDESPTTSGFEISVEMGMYLGNKNNANYYRGIHVPNESNYGDPNIFYIFNNKYWFEDIRTLMETDHSTLSDSIALAEVSEMRYQLAFAFNVGLRYRLNKYLTLSLSFGQALLTAQGTVVIDILNTSGVNIGEINHKQYPLIGKETRNFFGVDLIGYIPNNSIVTPFIEAGVHINSVKVKKADLWVEGQPFTLINWHGEGMDYVPNTEYTQIDPKLGGVGFGVGGGVGLKIAFTPWLSIDPVIRVSAERVKLAGYNKMAPNFNFSIRLVLSDKVFMKKKD